MSMHLRTAVEKLKEYYIQFLLNRESNRFSEDELRGFTITELKNLCSGSLK